MKAISQFITNYNYIIIIINVILIVSIILNINNNKKISPNLVPGSKSQCEIWK